MLDAVSTVAAAMWLPFQDGTSKHASPGGRWFRLLWRLHTHFDVEHWVPTDLELTDARRQHRQER